MQTKRIICPKCKAVLDVTNSKNETLKQITCPSCKTILQVKFQPQQERPQQEPIEAKTYYAPPKRSMADSGATQLAGAGGETVLGGGLSGATQLYTPTQKTTSTAKPISWKKAGISLAVKAPPQRQQCKSRLQIAI